MTTCPNAPKLGHKPGTVCPRCTPAQPRRPMAAFRPTRLPLPRPEREDEGVDDILDARSAEASGDTLAALLSGVDEIVAMSAAENPACPPGLLAQAATHHSALVRFAVAENPTTPRSTLHQMALAPGGDYDAALARNHAIAPETIDILIRSQHWSARRALAANPHLTDAQRRALQD